MTFVGELEPAALWRHFDSILTVPRASKDEGRMRDHVVSVADSRGLAHQVDAAGNLVVRKPATPGHEGAAVTILQSHLDMVQEKNADVDFDFTTDAIVPRMDGEYLAATGTTLGSDNGVGVATMLAVMGEMEFAHGPLELLFTVDEETGLTGATQLDADLLLGRQMINLDSEEDGIVYVGCAGGGDTQLTLGLETEPAPVDGVALSIALTGLKGGHSGCDIHLQRGNAVKLLGRALWAAHLGGGFRLARFDGGSAHNAIPREAFVTVIVTEEGRNGLMAAVKQEIATIAAEYAPADPGMQLSVDDAPAPETVWDEATTERVLRLVNALPHGVEAMSYDIPDLVETSVNLATVKPFNGALRVGLSSRSSIDSALEALRRHVRAVGLLAGAGVEEDMAYPGWKPDLESRLLEVVKVVHRRELGTEPEVKAIHAGLECGILGKKIPGIDMISVGPQIEFPHSPDERVHVASVGRFYRLVAATLTQLA
ncbi:MAG: aminoacyl-histidine dipeptidase [Vicinamibacterales bacterium]|jgi:dipeptidase D|nr:aminoacyl-histidine dipeptidase [Vicinamibacterales bacterium]